MPQRRATTDDEARGDAFRAAWNLRPGTIYLNHGSFGPPPEAVRAVRRAWQAEIDGQPMDFFVRRFEPALNEARQRLARFVGTAAENLVFVDNATAAVNVVAANFPLAAGDEVLLTDHEYGAVERIWKRACRRAGAKLKIAQLPLPMSEAEEVIEAIFRAAGPRTRLLVVSHITSPTAAILPVEAICRRAAERGMAVCIDGPHAVAQVDLAIDALDCDFYAASCHKWLSAPFGSGFLYVHPRRQAGVEPPYLSWGRLEPSRPATWADEFLWSGTRDPSAWLTVPAAIDWLQGVGLDLFRDRTHALARYARRRLVERIGMAPIVPDSPAWYGSMAHVPLPPGDARRLQAALWERHGIEVPVVSWKDRRWLRVSCHLYNRESDIDRLVEGVGELLKS
jgi:isopenicillin-N epimerase